MGSSQHQSGEGNSQNVQAGRDINVYLAPSCDAAEKRELKDEEGKLLASMSRLISEMRSDLLAPQAAFVREFFVLPNRQVGLGGHDKPRFIYYEEDHPNLRGQIDVLEEHGFVTDVTPVGNREQIYRMTEKLATQLHK